MKRTMLRIGFVGLCLLYGQDGLASFYGSDGQAGIWRGLNDYVESSTGENLIFKDPSCGTRNLSELRDGGAGGQGPYLRNDQPDSMVADQASLTLNAVAPGENQPVLRIQNNATDKILLDSSGGIASVSIEADAASFDEATVQNALVQQHAVVNGGFVVGSSITPTPQPGNIYIEGLMEHGSGVVRQFEHDNTYDEFWDDNENSLQLRASNSPFIEMDFDDEFVGINGLLGVEKIFFTSLESSVLRFFENGTIFNEHWNSEENELSFRYSDSPALEIDLDTGNATVGGDLILLSDEQISQNEDTAGEGPFILCCPVAFQDGFDVSGHGYPYLFESSNGDTFNKITLAVPVEQFGSTLVLDDIVIHGETTSASAYLDRIILREDNRLGGRTSPDPAMYDTNIGNGSSGTFEVDILSSDISRTDYSNRLYLQFNFKNPNSDGELRIFDFTVHYHLE